MILAASLAPRTNLSRIIVGDTFTTNEFESSTDKGEMTICAEPEIGFVCGIVTIASSLPLLAGGLPLLDGLGLWSKRQRVATSSSLARLGAALFFLCQSHAFALGAPQTATPPAANVQPVESVFVDLADHAAAVPAIYNMVAQGIMRGASQTQFAPDASYSMGEFAVSMQHMFNLPPPAQPISFTDVPRGSPIYDAVEAIVPFLDRGLLCPGCAAGSNFLPRQPVARAWATIIPVNILTAQNKIQSVSPAEAESALANVTDASWLPPKARIIFATALNNEIIGLHPQNEINLGFEPTRADMAVFLDAIQKRFNIPRIQPAPWPAP